MVAIGACSTLDRAASMGVPDATKMRDLLREAVNASAAWLPDVVAWRAPHDENQKRETLESVRNACCKRCDEGEFPVDDKGFHCLPHSRGTTLMPCDCARPILAMLRELG